MIRQRTLKSVVRATGVGVHTGAKVAMALRPAPVDTGIVFCRSDLPGNPAIPARAANVSNTTMATVIEKDGARVSTVEHLMSAFAGLGIDNAYVDVSAEEVPIMDGSAGTFVFLIQQAGIEEQSAPKRYLRVLKRVEVEQGDKKVSLEPFDGFKVGFSIEFNHPVFDAQTSDVEIDFADVSYVREVSRARTFGFTQDVEAMRAKGLGRGGSLDNVVVIDDFRVLNAEGLRMDDGGRPLHAGTSAHRRVPRPQVGPRAEQRAGAQAPRRRHRVGRGHVRKRGGAAAGVRQAAAAIAAVPPSTAPAVRCAAPGRPGRRVARHSRPALPADREEGIAGDPARRGGHRPHLRLRPRPPSLIAFGDLLQRLAQRRVPELARDRRELFDRDLAARANRRRLCYNLDLYFHPY